MRLCTSLITLPPMSRLRKLELEWKPPTSTSFAGNIAVSKPRRRDSLAVRLRNDVASGPLFQVCEAPRYTTTTLSDSSGEAETISPMILQPSDFPQNAPHELFGLRKMWCELASTCSFNVAVRRASLGDTQLHRGLLEPSHSRTESIALGSFDQSDQGYKDQQTPYPYIRDGPVDFLYKSNPQNQQMHRGVVREIGLFKPQQNSAGPYLGASQVRSAPPSWGLCNSHDCNPDATFVTPQSAMDYAPSLPVNRYIEGQPDTGVHLHSHNDSDAMYGLRQHPESNYFAPQLSSSRLTPKVTFAPHPGLMRSSNLQQQPSFARAVPDADFLSSRQLLDYDEYAFNQQERQLPQRPMLPPWDSNTRIHRPSSSASLSWLDDSKLVHYPDAASRAPSGTPSRPRSPSAKMEHQASALGSPSKSVPPREIRSSGKRDVAVVAVGGVDSIPRSMWDEPGLPQEVAARRPRVYTPWPIDLSLPSSPFWSAVAALEAAVVRELKSRATVQGTTIPTQTVASGSHQNNSAAPGAFVLRRAFAFFDRRGAGMVSIDDLHSSLADLGLIDPPARKHSQVAGPGESSMHVGDYDDDSSAGFSMPQPLAPDHVWDHTKNGGRRRGSRLQENIYGNPAEPSAHLREGDLSIAARKLVIAVFRRIRGEGDVGNMGAPGNHDEQVCCKVRLSYIESCFSVPHRACF